MFDGAGVVRENIYEYPKHDWKRAHDELTRLAKLHAAQDHEEARAILAARRARAHIQLGFASVVEYLERIFGWSPRIAKEKVRVAEALERLPLLARALREGLLHWSAVRELSRVATKETESDWLHAAHAKSMREIEQLVSGRIPGDRPQDRARPEARRHTILAEGISAETMALWREAQMMMQKRAGAPLTEDEAIRMIARAALGGPEDEGRANYQIVVSRCDECSRVTQRGRGEELDVDPVVLEAAECDAQCVDLRAASTPAPEDSAPHARATQTIPPAVRRLVMHRDHGRCVAPGCRHATFVDIHHLQLRSEGGTHDPDLLACLCSVHHQRVHEGRLIIEGRISTGLTFRHADGSHYGGAIDVDRAEIMSEAFEALLALGFGQGESRRALDAIQTHVGQPGAVDTPSAAVVLALRELRGTSAAG